jgi:hypothetical protein
LRDLYKREEGLAPWQEEDPEVLLDRIGQKEEAWERLLVEEIWKQWLIRLRIVKKVPNGR